MTKQKELFENWAETYENYVIENQHSFPFKGYSELVIEIVKSINPYSTVLDLGIGTGYISNKLNLENHCNIYGIDLSKKMTQISKNRIKDSVIVSYDLNNYQSFDWSIFPKKIDYILGTYFFHHYIDEVKIHFIEYLLTKVYPNAKIIIGDIGFLTLDLLTENKEKLKHEWDESEYYFDLETIQKMLESKGLNVQSKQVSEYCIFLAIWK